MTTESSKTSFEIGASTFHILIFLIYYICFIILLIFVFNNTILITVLSFYFKIISFRFI